ncbi:hypothetical protein IG197_16610 [Aminobacter sp. SR38]|uniref:hypothetical protein n=1 Tax=Aminobacter sp. SR38 TaxID=2774562 RepID=UPI00177B3482|nr:hypothetical protein [Aminobacter sp. SR38]QOF69490.1 hypothetical protein IG197_16610 [Aminobacter sp. SR38]
MGKQVFLTEREAPNALQHRRDMYLVIEKMLSPIKREQEGDLECIHCRGRFNGLTAAAWKFGLCDDCLQR